MGACDSREKDLNLFFTLSICLLAFAKFYYFTSQNGKFHSILDALHLTQLADQAAKKQGLSDLPYIRGGEMHLTGKRR